MMEQQKIGAHKKKAFLGIIAGLIAYSIIGSLGLYLLKICWADYAISSKDKSYTIEMLLSRLLVAVFASIAAGISVTKLTKDKGQSAWIVAAIILCAAAYVHFCRVWADYPAWYHVAYLVPIIPIIRLSHYCFRKQQ